MIKVFIGGSRTVTRPGAEVRRRLPVLVGDANGVDKAVQQHFKERQYSLVEVFCMEGFYRNNVGPWPIRSVPGRSSNKDFSYYSTPEGPAVKLKGGDYWFPLTPG